MSLGEFLTHTPAKRRDLLNQLLVFFQGLTVGFVPRTAMSGQGCPGYMFTRHFHVERTLGIEQLLSVQTAFIGARRLAKRIEKEARNAQSRFEDFFDVDIDDELPRCRQEIASLETRLQALKWQSGNRELYRAWMLQADEGWNEKGFRALDVSL